MAQHIEEVKAQRRIYQRLTYVRKKQYAWRKMDAKRNPGKWRRYYKERALEKSGWTYEQFTTAKRKQKGRCALCGAKTWRLCADHVHATKQPRELLCVSCNVLVGYAEHPRLADAMSYVEKHKAQTFPMGFELQED